MRFDWLSGWRRVSPLWKSRSLRSSGRRRVLWNRPAVGAEIFEARVLLTSFGLMPIASTDVDAAVSQSNEVLASYSAPVQEQYLQPVQSTLESAASSFIAETASMSSNAEITSDWSGTPIDSYFSVTDASTLDSTSSTLPVELDTASLGTTDSATTDGSSTEPGSDALFGQDANLQSYTDDLATTAFGGLLGGSGGSVSPPSPTTGGTTGSETTNTGTTGDGSGNSEDTGTTDDENTTGDGSSDASEDDSDDESTTPNWTPFVLPDGVAFDETHLPLESLPDPLTFQPTRLESFSETTVTETNSSETIPASDGSPASSSSVHTILTVTISQTYVDAEHWTMSQSWTREYTVTSSSGNADDSGPWSGTTRTGRSTFQITVSLGFGVPEFSTFRPRPSSSTPASSSEISLPGRILGPPRDPDDPVPVGPVTTVSFSDSDNQTTSVGDSWDNSDSSVGSVDNGSYSGRSTLGASRSATLTEFLVLLPGGVLARTQQASFNNDRSGSLTFSGSYGQFEAEGTVMDKNGVPTTGTSNPCFTPFEPLGHLPPTDPDDFLDGTAPSPPIGGDGSRLQARGKMSLSAAVATGVYLLGESTTPEGTELQDSSITGTTGIYTTTNGEASVEDSLSYENQTYAPGGDFSNLSIGWDSSANAASDLNFSLDMALGDADLPPPPSTGPTVGPTAEGSPDSQSANSESSSSTTSETSSGELSFAAPETADAGSEGGEPDGGSDGGEPDSGPPAIGAPSLSLTANRSNGKSDSTWAKLDFSEDWGEDKGTLSSSGLNAVSITAKTTFKN